MNNLVTTLHFLSLSRTSCTGTCTVLINLTPRSIVLINLANTYNVSSCHIRQRNAVFRKVILFSFQVMLNTKSAPSKRLEKCSSVVTKEEPPSETLCFCNASKRSGVKYPVLRWSLFKQHTPFLSSFPKTYFFIFYRNTFN
jgi:hypothetical protein